MRARVHVFYKDSVFDPAGNTLENSLRQQGFTGVSGVRIGKAIDMQIASDNNEEALLVAKQMCDKLLANPVIESYQVEILPS